MLTSQEFLAGSAVRAKVKTPLEYVVSSILALGGTVTHGGPLARALSELGMPLYQCQPPTDYSDRADAWVNTGALLAPMNLAVAWLANEYPAYRSVFRSAANRSEATRFRLSWMTSSSAMLPRQPVERSTEPRHHKRPPC